MAIIRGFPPSNTISPSVRITEKDLSLILPSETFHRAGVVGFASKGPINIPTIVRTRRELNITFGFPHPQESDPFLIYAAEQYLLVANELVVVRVGQDSPVEDEQAKTASVDVPSAGSLVIIESDTAGTYTFSSDGFFRWRLNGILSNKVLVVLAGTYTVSELADTLNSQVSSFEEGEGGDGIEFFVTDSDTIGVRTTFAYGSDAELELVSVQNAIYGGAVIDGNVTGWGTLMEVASTTGSNDRYPDTAYQTAGEYDFSGLTDLNLQIVVDGTNNSTIDNVIQVIDLEDLEGKSNTISEVVAEINSQAEGFEASATGNNLTLSTLAHGRDSKLLVRTESTADALFGFDNLTAEGVSPVGVTGDSDIETVGIANGAPDGSGGISFTLEADSPGIEGNSTQVIVTVDDETGNFSLNVFSNGDNVESWGNLTKNQDSRFYVETFLSLTSDFIRAVDNTTNPASPVGGTYDLSGGTDGIPADPDEQDELIIGSNIAMTGMQALSDPEQVEIDLLTVPGHSSTSVVLAMLDLCQNVRQDCFAIIDPPFGLTVNEIVDWQNGQHPLNLTRFDSDFGALYWPWVRIRDNVNRVDVWVPPSGSVLAVYARSDNLAAPWFAPAGIERGIVPNISDVFSRPSLEERDRMYGDRNAINPIVQFPDVDSFLVWGNKTLQRRPTALDRINVRRMLIVAEKRIRRAVRSLIFEPHDEILRQEFIDISTVILEDILNGRGITDFRIQCDEELNTPDVIDRNELRARIGVVPTRAAEFIFIEFSIHRTGAFEAGDTFA